MILNVLVVTNSKEEKIKKISQNNFKIWVKSLPEKGKANNDVMRILKNKFKFKTVKIVKGFKGKRKILECQ